MQENPDHLRQDDSAYRMAGERGEAVACLLRKGGVHYLMTRLRAPARTRICANIKLLNWKLVLIRSDTCGREVGRKMRRAKFLSTVDVSIVRARGGQQSSLNNSSLSFNRDGKRVRRSSFMAVTLRTASSSSHLSP